MSEFTYEPPDKKMYMKAIHAQLRLEGLEPISDLLKGCTCEITHNQQFSYKRWNGFRTTVNFYVPLDKYEVVANMLSDYNGLVEICDDIMPPKAGLDVMEVKFKPSLETTQIEESIIDELEKPVEVLSENVIKEILSDDIKIRGKEMADSYIYLYCIENVLRLFIEKIVKENYGKNYFSYLNTNREIQDKLIQRKRDERKNQWLRIRGDSEIFYLDFDDLASLIRNNWELFKDWVPSQSWIVTKIQELSKCRNLVAHNSYLGENERDLIRVYFNSVLKQISSTYI